MTADLQNAVLDQLGKDMAASIDFQVLVDTLVAFGWVEHQVEPWYKANHSVTSWCERNTKGEWTHLNNRFLFESTQDANWFALRWL
jgi:hypothetical protein